MKRKIGLFAIGLVITGIFIAIIPTTTLAEDLELYPDLIITNVGVIHGLSWRHHYVTPWIKNNGNAPVSTTFHTSLAFEQYSKSGFGYFTVLKIYETDSLPIGWTIPLLTFDHLWYGDWNQITGRYIVHVDCYNEINEGPSGGENNNWYNTSWWPWEP
jgi:hypothetical protein